MNNRLLKSIFTSLINYRLLTGIAVVGILTGCSSSGMTVADNNNNLSNSIVVEKSAIIPVLDGKATTAGVYIHNTTNKAISGISYALAQNNSSTSLTINSASCNTIAANSSCLLPITTPALANGNSGNNILVASYHGQQSKQLINYRYVNTNDYNGINFSDNSQTLFGTSDYATVYVFAGKGQYYNNIGFNLSNNSLAISSGLTNGTTTIPANSIVPLEIQSNHNVTSNLVTVIPYVQTTSKNLAKALVSGIQNNSQLQVAITPTQQANLLMSDVPVLTNSESTTTLTIFNNGNQTASSLNLTSDSANVTVTIAATNPCGSSLASGASCNYTINKNNTNSNGSALLTLSYNNSQITTTTAQTVYYLNSNSEPMVSVVATQTNFSEQVATNQNITFNITNSGNAPLNSANITTKTTLAHTNLTIQNNTCTTTIAANSSCSLQVNVAASDLIDNGVVYLNLSGTYAGVMTKSYSFMSKPVYATIVDTSTPSVTSTTPQDTATSISTSSSITVNFSEAMTPTTLNTSNILLQKVSDSSSVPLTLQGVSNNNQTVTFTQTSGTLLSLTQYQIVINPSQIKDANGNAMSAATSQIVATFTTGDTTPPTISSYNPANGATNLSQTPTINISFSEAMDQTTLTTSNVILQTQAGTTVSGYTITYNPATYTATINLNSNLLTSQTTYQLIINQNNLKDLSGNTLGSNSNYQVSQFTIGDYTAPTLSSSVPINGATNIAVESAISLTFSEAMDTSTLTSTTVKLQKANDSSNISLNAPIFSNSNQTVTFQPTASLSAGESYNIVINPSAIKDAAGNVMSAAISQVVSNFKTISDIASGVVLSGVEGMTFFDGNSLSLSYNGLASLSSIAYGNSVYVAIGSNGMSPYLGYSSDGLSWSTGLWYENYNITQSLTKVIFAQGKFVAVGYSGIILYSTDGIIWHQATSNTTANFMSVANDGSKFIAVGYIHTKDVVHGDSKYAFYQGIIQTSNDGVTWSNAVTSDNYYPRNLVYNSSNGLYVAILNQSDSFYPDYYLASAASLSLLDNNIRKTIDGTGNGFAITPIAVNESNTIIGGYSYSWESTVFYTSSDGISFNQNIISGSSNQLQPNSIVFDSISQQFIATGCYSTRSPGGGGGCSGTSGLIASTNNAGTTWGNLTQISALPPINSMIITAGKLVGVTGGYNAVTGIKYTDYSAISTNNGSTWQSSGTFNFIAISNYAYGRGLYVGVSGYYQNGVIYHSSDGKSWVATTTNIPSGCVLNNVIYTGSSFIAVGYDASYNSLVLRSVDGVTWSDITLANSGALIAVNKRGSELVAISSNPAVIISNDDGLTWQEQSATLPSELANMYSLGSSGSRLVAVGYSSNTAPVSEPPVYTDSIFYSNDGVNWLSAGIVSGDTLYGISYANGHFVAVGVDATYTHSVVLFSSDGMNWTSSVSAVLSQVKGLTSVTYFNGKWYAAGLAGAFLISTDNGVTWNYVTNNDVYDISYLGQG